MYLLDWLRIIDQRVDRAIVNMTQMGTVSTRDAGNRAMVTMDGSSVAVPCKVPTTLEVTQGDRVVLLRMGSDKASRSAEYVVVAAFGTRPAWVTDTDLTSRTTSATTLTGTLDSGGVECAITFTAPPSGKVLFLFSAELSTSGAFALATIEVRRGTTIGSGEVVFSSPSFDDTIRTSDGAMDRFDNHIPMTLDRGQAYNAVMMQATSGAASTFARRRLTMVPLP